DFIFKSKKWFKRLIGTIREFAMKIKESEKWFSTTLNSIGDAVIATDKLGNIRFMNPIAEILTGWMQNESIGKPLEEIFKIINEDTRSSVENPVSRVIREGIVVGLANHTVLIAKDGKEIPIADSGAPIKDDSGNIIGIVLIFRDITEQKKAERILKESREYAESIVNTIREPLIVLDKNLKIISANKSFYETFKDSPEDTENQFIYDLGNRQWDIPKLRELLEEILPNNTSFNNFEVEWDFEKIGRKVMILNARRLYNDPKNTKMILLAIEDITERRRTEQKLKKSEENFRNAYKRADFYKDIFSHDINNILQNILSGIQLIETYITRQEKPKNFENIYGIIKEQVLRGAKLVYNIRKLSKLEENEILIKKINLYLILENTISYVNASYKNRNINIQIESKSRNYYVQANELLEDIFENILINAIKFNNNPLIKITVKISIVLKNGKNYVKMEFKDNGVGIDDARKDMIFLRGYNQDKSIYGMGLGLSLVKKIIDAYGGKIWVEDRIQGDYRNGSNFILLIPMVI
ncbi:MAG: PAS domain S-box protein, partial [Promethearchaeota archaeon]